MYLCAYPITSWGKLWLKSELLLDYTSHFPRGELPIMANMSKMGRLTVSNFISAKSHTKPGVKRQL